MFQARQIASRFTSNLAAVLVVASCSGFAAAQSAVPGNQWRAAGSTYSDPNDSSSAGGGWQLPNAKAILGDTSAVDEDSNPLRKTNAQQSAPKANPKPAEPRSFQAPKNAAPMNANQSAATTRNTQQTNQQRGGSAAQVSKPGTIVQQAYVSQQPQFNRPQAYGQQGYGQRQYVQPNYRPAANNQFRPNSQNGNAQDPVSIAFNGPAAQATQSPAAQSAPQTSKVVKQGTTSNRSAEMLPMPGDGDYNMNDPVMRYPGGPGEFADHLGGNCYQPYCESGTCCDGSCSSCPGPCCGEGCEPGCDCPCGAACGEPGCDCPCPKKDVFCIGPGDDESCHIVQVRWPKWQEVVAFGGVQGFKGPYDRERDSGNFGFNEGFNIGAKVPYCALGYQFGYRAVESQLNGDTDTGIDKSFNQSFVTAGLFHRQKEGLNFGVVWDALVDERAPSNNFHQIRSELSVVGCGCHEIGFGAIVGTNNHGIDDGNGTILNYQASDQYTMFYRLHGPNGGEGRIYAGVNNDSDGILGADTLVPVGGSFSLSSEFAYLIPSEKNGTAGASHEAWNVGVGLVWHWDGQARKCFDNCYRPLFNVADNGTLIVDQQTKHN